MRLLSKYNRINIVTTILVFVAGSVGFYFILEYVLRRQLDESLHTEQQEITAYVTKHDSLPIIEDARDQWIAVKSISLPTASAALVNSEQYNLQEKEKQAVRQLVFSIRAGGKWYAVTVSKWATETEYLLKLIIGIAVSMIAVVLVTNYVINRTVIRRLWQPFYRTIDSIKSYRPNDHLDLPGEKIDEVQLLNQSLNQMAGQINQDYQLLRSFTENASHEMQTPLAVIRSKTEALFEYAEGNEKGIQHLSAIEDAALKLSRLHQSLLLLTKLKNRQFETAEEIDFRDLVQRKVNERAELFEAKKITVFINGVSSLQKFHPHLADIFVSNLLNNALRYTPQGGEVDIYLDERSFSIHNTAAGGALDGSKIFQRFYKADTFSESTGLGLSIVDEICAVSGGSVVYGFHDGKHGFRVYFV